MSAALSLLDWTIIGGYLIAVFLVGAVLARRRSVTMEEYFRGGNQMSTWVVAFSVIATTQSAATFLGGPDYGYRGDYTYLGSFVGSAMAAMFVARYLAPRFYALNVTTVYELLETRYGAGAKRAAGAMYLLGRLLANGARLYMAALALAMMLFFDISAGNVLLAVAVMTVLSVAATLVGGIRSVIWSDFAQFLVYFGAAVVALCSLWLQLGLPLGEVVQALAAPPGGGSKLVLFDFTTDFSKPFGFWAIITGVFLLNLGNFGLDQDTTQRLLTCRDARASGRALVLSAVAAVPIVWVFVSIGQLLHLFYDRPDLTGAAAGGVVREFDGEKITVFMSYILSEMPSGVRGLVVAGVMAAAVSTMTSGLNAMSSVLISDFYKPWREARGQRPTTHYVQAGRWGMLLFAVLLGTAAGGCYFWQRHADTPLLEFALAVMAFAYAGLIGVFFTAVFTRRGSERSVIAALIVGFLLILVQQPYIVDSLQAPEAWKQLSFPWQLLIGVAGAMLVCGMGNASARAPAPLGQTASP